MFFLVLCWAVVSVTGAAAPTAALELYEMGVFDAFDLLSFFTEISVKLI